MVAAMCDMMSAPNPITPRKRFKEASATERAMAARVARWVLERDPESKWDALLALVLICGRFPEISLQTAIVGYVFRDMYAEPRRVLQ